jgi:hypothetical protein
MSEVATRWAPVQNVLNRIFTSKEEPSEESLAAPITSLSVYGVGCSLFTGTWSAIRTWVGSSPDADAIIYASLDLYLTEVCKGYYRRFSTPPQSNADPTKYASDYLAAHRGFVNRMRVVSRIFEPLDHKWVQNQGMGWYRRVALEHEPGPVIVADWTNVSYQIEDDGFAFWEAALASRRSDFNYWASAANKARQESPFDEKTEDLMQTATDAWYALDEAEKRYAKARARMDIFMRGKGPDPRLDKKIADATPEERAEQMRRDLVANCELGRDEPAGGKEYEAAIARAQAAQNPSNAKILNVYPTGLRNWRIEVAQPLIAGGPRRIGDLLVACVKLSRQLRQNEGTLKLVSQSFKEVGVLPDAEPRGRLVSVDTLPRDKPINVHC